MKKYLLVSLTILFAAAFLWADEAMLAEPKIDVSGNGKLEWGVDLGTGTDSAKHGFKNSAEWEVKFPLIKKGDKTSEKKDVPVYGEVVLKDIELNIVSKNDAQSFAPAGKVDKLQAKLVFYGAYLTVYNAPSFKSNYAELWKPVHGGDHVGFKFEPGFGGVGFKLGYANSNIMDLDVGLKFGSNGNWENTDSYHSKYGAGLDFSMKPLKKMLGFDLTVNSTFAHAKDDPAIGSTDPTNKNYGYTTGVDAAQSWNKIALNFGTKITSEPIDALKFALGFDGGTSFNANGKDAFAWDMLFSTEYKWVSGGLYVASAGTPYQSVTKDKKNSADLGVFFKFETKGDKKEASNLVEGLDAGFHIAMYKLLEYRAPTLKNQLPMLMKLWASYKANINDSMWIKPFTNFFVESNNANASATMTPSFAVAYDLGVVYSPVEKVEVEAKWTHGLVQKDTYAGATELASKYVITNPVNGSDSTKHKGRFVLGVKVSY